MNIELTLTTLDENQLSFSLPKDFIPGVLKLTALQQAHLDKVNNSTPESAKERFLKQQRDCNADGAGFRSLEEVLAATRAEMEAHKLAGSRNAFALFNLIRPVARDFLVAASEHCDDIEKSDREEAEEYGVPYHASCLVAGVRNALAALDRNISKLERMNADNFTMYLRSGDLCPWIRELHDKRPKQRDAHAERLAAKPKPQEEQRPVHELSPAEQKARADAITAEKLKLRAAGQL